MSADLTAPFSVSSSKRYLSVTSCMAESNCCCIEAFPAMTQGDILLQISWLMKLPSTKHFPFRVLLTNLCLWNQISLQGLSFISYQVPNLTPPPHQKLYHLGVQAIFWIRPWANSLQYTDRALQFLNPTVEIFSLSQINVSFATIKF